MVIAIVFAIGCNTLLTTLLLNNSQDEQGNVQIPKLTSVTGVLTGEIENMANEDNWYAQESGTSVTYMASGYSAVKWTGIAVLALVTMAAGTAIFGGFLLSASAIAGLTTALGIMYFFTGLFMLIMTLWIYYEVYVVVFKPKSG